MAWLIAPRGRDLAPGDNRFATAVTGQPDNLRSKCIRPRIPVPVIRQVPPAKVAHARILECLDKAVNHTPLKGNRPVRRHRRAAVLEQVNRVDYRHHRLAVLHHQGRKILQHRPPVLGILGNPIIRPAQVRVGFQGIHVRFRPVILQERTVFRIGHRHVIHLDAQGNRFIALRRVDRHRARVGAGHRGLRHVHPHQDGLRGIGYHADGAGIRQGVRGLAGGINSPLKIGPGIGGPGRLGRNGILGKMVRQVVLGNRIVATGEVGKRDRIDGKIRITAQHHLPAFILVLRRRQGNGGRRLRRARPLIGHPPERVGRPHLQRA